MGSLMIKRLAILLTGLMVILSFTIDGIDAVTTCSGSLDDSVKLHCHDSLCFTAYSDILRSRATARGCYKALPGCQDCPKFMKGSRAQLCCFCQGDWCNAASMAKQGASNAAQAFSKMLMAFCAIATIFFAFPMCGR